MTLQLNRRVQAIALGLVVSLSGAVPLNAAEPANGDGDRALGADAEAPASFMSFVELQSSVERVGALHSSERSPARLIEEWLAGRDLNELSIDDVRWCFVNSLPNEQERRSFSVTWTGILTPPRTGLYVFSVSPINVNGIGRDATRHRISVNVAETEVLSTEDESHSEASLPAVEPINRSAADSRQPAAEAIVKKWNSRGTPIELQGSHPSPIEVVLEYEGVVGNDSSPPSAILCWEGPGLERQPVGESYFSNLARTPGGLKAEYKWQDAQGPHSVVQESACIDYAWTSSSRVAPSRPQLNARLADRLWLLAVDPEYLKKCAAGESEHVYFQDYLSTEYLSTARRQQFLELLVEQPDLLVKASDKAVLRLYRKLRFGAEEAALDMLGHWMQLHADLAPEIAADFFSANREVYWELAHLLTQQLPGQYQSLQDRFLEMGDGRCALPVAYTVAYAHLLEQSLPGLADKSSVAPGVNEWISLLSDSLADASLSGDLRVNWLLARAQAEESRHSLGQANLVAGQGWLDEASLVAEGEEVRLRVANERITRLAGMKMWPEAVAELEATPGAPDGWSGKLRQLKEQQLAAARQEATNLRLAHIREFERRRQVAADRGDTIAEVRYADKLSRLDADSE
jgi:hypothetical protein